MNFLTLILLISFVFIIWILYLEFSPTLGNIIYRTNANGTKSFSIRAVWNMMIQPFSQMYFWDPRFWDLNIYIILIISILVVILLERMIKFK